MASAKTQAPIGSTSAPSMLAGKQGDKHGTEPVGGVGLSR